MTDSERELLILVATYLANEREFAVRRRHGGKLIGTALAEVHKFRELIAKIEGASRKDAVNNVDSANNI